MVYDAAGGGAAAKVARKLVAAGYAGPRVVTGGYEAWVAAGFPTEVGAPATRVAYTPKPKGGSLSAAGFRAFAKAIPPGAVLIDVRGEDEVAAKGMVRGAVNIPCERLAERLAEIPKDKDVVLYCNTGVMAEMGYNILKEKGVRSRFVDAAVATRRDGGFKAAN